MRLALLLTALALAGCNTTGSSSSSDDRRWINQCLRDNAGENVSRRIVTAYCSCMNDRMSNNETRSISQWERANPRAQRECSRQAGWN